MLSRSAERVYWLGRYLERAENTARIVQQYSQLLLDLPSEVGVEWGELAAIFGVTGIDGDSDATQREILDLLVANPDSYSSLAHSIESARDNIRNARDLLPQESWESANELMQYARRHLAAAADGRNRFEVLAECIGRCQLINGVLAGTMSHGAPYRFLLIGQNIERADMTSRIIDVAAAYLQQNEVIVQRYGSTLWTNVLKSVSGFQMYRQYRKPEVTGVAVTDFLLNDHLFPRAVRSCIERTRKTAAALPRGEELGEALTAVESQLPGEVPADIDGAAVSELMDELQVKLAGIHNAVVETWFLPGE